LKTEKIEEGENLSGLRSFGERAMFVLDFSHEEECQMQFDAPMVMQGMDQGCVMMGFQNPPHRLPMAVSDLSFPESNLECPR
jgi:hypothetical protein